MSQSKQTVEKGDMKWWQLGLFGVGSTIGTGFFLGSSFGIKLGGLSVLLSFLLAGAATYIVYDGLSKMTEKDPQKGSFRIYAKKAYGDWAGFSVGWAYWVSEVLIMGSQLTALSIFSRFWFPAIPMWMFAIGYAVLGIIVLLLGANKLSKAENIFGIMKIAAIVMFIFVAVGLLFGWFGLREVNIPQGLSDFFPKGFVGFWSSLIFAFYAFGGIEVMGLMATSLKDPKEAPKAGRIMIILLVIIYILSIGLTLLLVTINKLTTDESPFVITLKTYDFTILSHIFNGVLIIAGFSTMVASFYGVTSVLVSLAEGGDATELFAKKGKLAIPFPSLILLMVGLTASIVTSLVLPDKIYEYITTGAGLMLLYNWLFIILSAKKLLDISPFVKSMYWLGILLLLLGISGTMMDKSNRMGLFISIGFVLIIGIVTFFLMKKRKAVEAY
jgi:L-asparagine transporter-like permease